MAQFLCLLGHSPNFLDFTSGPISTPNALGPPTITMMNSPPCHVVRICVGGKRCGNQDEIMMNPLVDHVFCIPGSSKAPDPDNKGRKTFPLGISAGRYVKNWA